MAERGMVRSIVRYTVIVMLLALVVLWFLGGGVQKIISGAGSMHFSTFADLLTASTSLSTFQLPGAPPTPSIDVSPVYMPGDQGHSSGENSSDHSTFASASPYAGDVKIDAAAARTQTTSGEYIILNASGAKESIDISGWSLESALTGTRAYIPQASPQFVQGAINTVADVKLAPGGQAVLVTGSSPVGVSFRENMCTGYLGTLQPFVPALAHECPAPTYAIPRTDVNTSELGADCFAYLSQLPTCTFPTNPPQTLSAACHLAVQSTLSYGGCVDEYKGSGSFQKNSWRIYLAQGSPLWGAQHEVIRLLDGQGRIVDVLNY